MRQMETGPSTTPTPSLFPGIPEAPQDASGAS